jgi:hypothetical protein
MIGTMQRRRPRIIRHVNGGYPRCMLGHEAERYDEIIGWHTFSVLLRYMYVCMY